MTVTARLWNTKLFMKMATLQAQGGAVHAQYNLLHRLLEGKCLLQINMLKLLWHVFVSEQVKR